jgi:hypothetical protein
MGALQILGIRALGYKCPGFTSHVYTRGGGISLVVQKTVTLILYTELNNDEAYILHFIEVCTRQAIPIPCSFLRS